MKHPSADKYFKLQPEQRRAETKGDITSRVARDITRTEAARRDAKTDRLRAQRLAQAAEAGGTTATTGK